MFGPVHWEPQHNKCVAFQFPRCLEIVDLLLIAAGVLRLSSKHFPALFWSGPIGKLEQQPYALCSHLWPWPGNVNYVFICLPQSSCWYCLSISVQVIFLRACEVALITNYICSSWRLRFPSSVVRQSGPTWANGWKHQSTLSLRQVRAMQTTQVTSTGLPTRSYNKQMHVGAHTNIILNAAK